MTTVDPAPILSDEMSPTDTSSLVRPARAESFTSAQFIRAACLVFILSAILAFVYLARAVVLPVLLSFVMCLVLKTPVGWLRHAGLPVPLAAALVVGLFVTGISIALVQLGRPAVEWLAAAPETLPRLKAKFPHFMRPAARLSEAAAKVGNFASEETLAKPQPVEVKDNHMANTVFTWTGSLLAGAGETVALLFLLLASGDSLILKLVKVLPKFHDKRQAVAISHEVQRSISTYLFSLSLINLGFGLVVGVAFHLFGLPNAMMWGGIAACANFIPYIGPFLGITAVALTGLLASDSLGWGLLPAGAYLLTHALESNVITPFVLGRRFALNPVLIFIALIFCTWLWGVIGAVLSVPLLVVVKTICDHVPALSVLGELLVSYDVHGNSAQPKTVLRS